MFSGFSEGLEMPQKYFDEPIKADRGGLNPTLTLLQKKNNFSRITAWQNCHGSKIQNETQGILFFRFVLD